jgi:hypothetical protein
LRKRLEKIMKSWQMSCREKQIASLRISYSGGYSGFFAEQVRRMITQRFARSELLGWRLMKR